MDDHLIPKIAGNIEFTNFSKSEYLLHDTIQNHYVKISNEVYDLLCLIDGKKSIHDIIIAYNNEYDLELTKEFVHDLLYKKLQPYGLLEGENENLKKYKKPGYLNLSFIIFNENLLKKITPFFGFLFKSKISICVIILCIGIIGSCLYYHFDLYSSFNLRNSLIYFFILMAMSTTFHEIGHASSANYFGAKHGGIGGGFYLFTPVYYADVTDVWRLPKKQRIVVNLAGMYFELIFCSLIVVFATLILKNSFLAVLASIVCIKTLNNLNPFLRSDGYWIFSDIINKPNLMSHAGKKVLSIFSKKQKKWKGEDFLLFFYGLISYSIILLFVYYVIIKNPNSILLFPKNLYIFFKNLFTRGAEFSFSEFAQLLVPMLFFYLLFNFIKGFIISKKDKLSKS